MPSLSAVPATPPVWDIDAYWPMMDAGSDQGGGGFFSGFNADSWGYRESGRATGVGTANVGVAWGGPGVGGGGVTDRMQVQFGCAYVRRFDTTGVIAGNVLRPPSWSACYDPGAAAGGMLSREDMRVHWWREVWAWTGFGDGGSGNVWSWDLANAAAVTWAQNGSLVQQYGVYGNGVGGLEYRSYSAAAALLETVAIPGVAVNQWITFDHQHVSWAPGRPATYELRVNGTRIVQRTFGTAQLPFPATGGQRLQIVQRRLNTAGQTFCAYWRLRCGRFTMDGSEVRT